MEKNMISFKNWLKNSRKQNIREALTIPADKAGEIEKKLRVKLEDKEFKQRYPKFQYHDIIVKCCRNDEKSENPKEVERTYITGLSNIMDMFDVYDKTKQAYRFHKMTKRVSVRRQDGKEVELDPIKDIGKIGKLDVLRQFVDNFDKLVNSDDFIPATFEKYAITDEDRKYIRLIGWNDNVMVWGTKKFEPSQKFAVQLWQNIETIDSAGEYGNPESQCPYCTHAKSHWDRHAGNNDNYEQFWYLEIPSGFGDITTAGDLTNSSVVRLFNKLKGLGPDILCGQNDSDNDWCDRNDTPIAEYDFDIQDLNEEGEIELDEPDDDGNYETIDVDFNGYLDDVKELDSKYFAEVKPHIFDMQKWETRLEYDKRVRDAQLNSTIFLKTEIPDEKNTKFDIEKDVWPYILQLTNDSFEDVSGHRVLKAGYPKRCYGIRVRDAVFDSFRGFPTSVSDHSFILNVLNCEFTDFSDFPKLEFNGACDMTFTNCRGVRKYDILGKLHGTQPEISLKITTQRVNEIEISTEGSSIQNLRELTVDCVKDDQRKTLDLHNLDVGSINVFTVHSVANLIRTSHVVDVREFSIDVVNDKLLRGIKTFVRPDTLVINMYSLRNNNLINNKNLRELYSISENVRIYNSYHIMKITDPAMFDGLPCRKTLADCFYGVSTEEMTDKKASSDEILASMVLKAYRTASKDYCGSDGLFDHKLLPVYRGNARPSAGITVFAAGKTYNLCRIAEDQLRFYDANGVEIEKLQQVEKIIIGFDMPSDEKIADVFFAALRRGEFRDVQIVVVNPNTDFRNIPRIDHLICQLNNSSAGKSLKISNCMIKKLHIQGNAQSGIDISQSNIILFERFSSVNQTTITDSMVGFGRVLGDNLVLDNCDIHLPLSVMSTEIRFLPNENPVKVGSFSWPPSTHIENSRITIGARYQDLQLKARHNFNSENFKNNKIMFLSGKPKKIAFDLDYSDKPLEFVRHVISDFGDQLTDVEAVEIYFRDRKSINDIVESLKSLSASALIISGVGPNNFNFNGCKFDHIIVENVLPSNTTLIGMPYVRYLTFFRCTFSSGMKISSELKNYFDLTSSTSSFQTYEMKKEFIDSSGHLNPNLTESSALKILNSDDATSDRVAYIALKLTDQSKRRLIAEYRRMFGGKYAWTACDHVTLAYGEDQIDAFDLDLFDETASIEIWNVVYDDHASAAVVDLEQVEHLGVNNEHPHITLGVSNGTRPVYSNTLIQGYFDEMNDAKLIQLDKPIVIDGVVKPVFKRI